MGPFLAEYINDGFSAMMSASLPNAQTTYVTCGMTEYGKRLNEVAADGVHLSTWL